jgi:negative regulator of flagellin synthesis FlgM
MKIDSTAPSTVSLSKTRQQRPAGPGPTRGATTEGSAALSPGGSLVAEAAGAPIDSQRIAEIRQSIADGKLKINAERIADRLIEGAREQLAKDRNS